MPSSFIIHPVAKPDEAKELAKEYGANSLHVRWYKLLHIHRVILFFAGLMLVDVVLLIVTLILEGIYPECHMIDSRCLCDAIILPDVDVNGTCAKTCVEPPESVQTGIEAMNIISMIILVIFLLEVGIQVWCIGLHRFVRHPFLILDLAVILASLGIEIYVLVHHAQLKLEEEQHKEEHGEGSVYATDADAQAISVALLLVSRSWRLIRISHSTLTEAHEYYEEHIDKLKEQIQALQAKLDQHQPTTTTAQEEEDTTVLSNQ